ncbi:hypothetical protein ACJJTC_002225 [Scirpophaga incertulas]
MLNLPGKIGIVDGVLFSTDESDHFCYDFLAKWLSEIKHGRHHVRNNVAIFEKQRTGLANFRESVRSLNQVRGLDDIPKWFAYKKLLFLKDRNKPEETVDGGLSVNETQSEKQISDTNTDSGVPTEKPFTGPENIS